MPGARWKMISRACEENGKHLPPASQAQLGAVIANNLLDNVQITWWLNQFFYADLKTVFALAMTSSFTGMRVSSTTREPGILLRGSSAGIFKSGSCSQAFSMRWMVLESVG